MPLRLVSLALLTALATTVGADPVTLASGPVHGAVVLTHGGAGSPSDWSGDCEAAARDGAAAFGSPLDAACAAVVHLENLCRFNAGTGANIRLDGKTIQMDAAVMTSDGNFAAVAAIERVLNPVLVAREVLATPHRLLAGDGATRFAHVMGFADQVPICDEAISKNRRRIALLLAGKAGGGYDAFDWRRAWNYPTPAPTDTLTLPEPDHGPKGDTVGAVARSIDGAFAVALSTGGTSITLYGRVGDVPIYGCGCYTGPDGAVACTGFGEDIIRLAMARLVYGLIAQGQSAREAVIAGCAAFPADSSIGLIAVGEQDWAVASSEDMAWGVATP